MIVTSPPLVVEEPAGGVVSATEPFGAVGEKTGAVATRTWKPAPMSRFFALSIGIPVTEGTLTRSPYSSLFPTCGNWSSGWPARAWSMNRFQVGRLLSLIH